MSAYFVRKENGRFVGQFLDIAQVILALQSNDLKPTWLAAKNEHGLPYGDFVRTGNQRWIPLSELESEYRAAINRGEATAEQSSPAALAKKSGVASRWFLVILLVAGALRLASALSGDPASNQREHELQRNTQDMLRNSKRSWELILQRASTRAATKAMDDSATKQGE